MKKPRIIFMGTPEFAANSLKALHESGANIVAVITAPDRKSGRGMKLSPSAVSETARELNLPTLKPEKLKNEDFLAELKALKPDIQVVVAFRMLPEVVWNLPRLGTFNIHASLLPQYRGAAPINWALINGEKQSGVSSFFLSHEIDTGNVIFQEKIDILPDDDAGTLHDKLMLLGAELMLKTVNAIADGTAKAYPQSALEAGEVLKTAPKIFKDDCRIDWNQPSPSIHNKIRGLSPYPAAWTEISTPGTEPLMLKIFRAKIATDSQNLKPGEIFSDGKTVLKVGTADGLLQIEELQLAGKKRMPTSDFLRGYNLQPATQLS